MAEVLVTTIERQSGRDGAHVVWVSTRLEARVERPVREQGFICPSEIATEEWPYVTLCALPLGHLEAHEGYVYESDSPRAKPIFTSW